MDITVFLGAPGSGKGTQAKRLSQGHQFKHFSTGDMLRAAIKEGSEVGKKAKGFIDRGELVPDNIMIELIETALASLPPSTRVVLDGFPRTVPQADALDRNPKTSVARSVYFNVAEADLVKRLTGRRICESCGEPYHVDFMAPRKDGVCDKCGGKLMQRSDDREDVVTKRLSVYKEQTSPLLSYYKKNQKLRELDGNQNVDKLQNELLRMLY